MPADNYLNGVTCASATDCWAVGEYLVGGILEQTLVEHWDGNSWTIVNSANPPNTFVDNSLTGVTCTSALNCWAAGHYNTGHYVGTWFVSGPDQTLIEHWDGNSWIIATSPTQGIELEDVTCVASNDCWAVGDYIDVPRYSVSHTLTEHYTASPPPLTDAVSRMTHGAAGAFDINLPLTGNSGIECRSGGSAGNHQMVVPFQNPVTCNSAQVTNGTGSVSNFLVSVDGTQVTVNLTSVSNVQTIVVTLNVTDDHGYPQPCRSNGRPGRGH